MVKWTILAVTLIIAKFGMDSRPYPAIGGEWAMVAIVALCLIGKTYIEEKREENDI